MKDPKVAAPQTGNLLELSRKTWLIRAILSVEGSYLMSDISRSRYVAQDKSTVYGIDTALVIVIFASALFWLSIGVLVWLLV